MKPDKTNKPEGFLVGIQPGQSFGEFKEALIAKLAAQGFFAPEPPEADAPAHTDDPPERPRPELQSEGDKGGYSGIDDHVAHILAKKLPPCPQCQSTETKSVEVGIVGYVIELAVRTKKLKLIPNGPKPAEFFCPSCGLWFNAPDPTKAPSRTKQR